MAVQVPGPPTCFTTFHKEANRPMLMLWGVRREGSGFRRLLLKVNNLISIIKIPETCSTHCIWVFVCLFVFVCKTVSLKTSILHSHLRSSARLKRDTPTLRGSTLIPTLQMNKLSLRKVEGQVDIEYWALQFLLAYTRIHAQQYVGFFHVSCCLWYQRSNPGTCSTTELDFHPLPVSSNACSWQWTQLCTCTMYLVPQVPSAHTTILGSWKIFALLPYSDRQISSG